MFDSAVSEIEINENEVVGFSEAFDAAFEARHADGFNEGYQRAINDLLTDFVLISEEFLQTQRSPNPQLREALRAFELHLQNRAPGSRAQTFVEAGLGI